MSRSIYIGYEDAAGKDIGIEIRPPYYLRGTQQTSLKFWSIPRLKEIGIERLTILGETDPLYFSGGMIWLYWGRKSSSSRSILRASTFTPRRKRNASAT